MGNRNRWPDGDVRALVAAFVQVERWAVDGRRYSIPAVVGALKAGPLGAWTEAAIHRRLAQLAGLVEAAGYAPLPDLPGRGGGVDAKERARYLRLLAEAAPHRVERAPAVNVEATADPRSLAARTAALLSPKGRHILHHEPPSTWRPPAPTRPVLALSPVVRAWVRQEAGGLCEGCGSPAPFTDAHGHPHLEVAYLAPVAHGGPDCTANAVAVCPTCRARLHHAADREDFRDAIWRAHRRLSRFHAIPRSSEVIPLEPCG